jgi:hypothetical protein
MPNKTSWVMWVSIEIKINKSEKSENTLAKREMANYFK